MLKGNKKTKYSPKKGKSNEPKEREVGKNSDLTESAQNQKISIGIEKVTFQNSEPLLDVQREYPKSEKTSISPKDKQSTGSHSSIKETVKVQASNSIQVISREHLECSVCEVDIRSTDLYILSCYHTVCLGCVRIEEGYYKCPNDPCISVASVQFGELRANMLSQDYKGVLLQMERLEKQKQGGCNKQDAYQCEDCYSTHPQQATHICMECNRLMCTLCLGIHYRGDGAHHLILKGEELTTYKVEQLMSEMQDRLGKCKKHNDRSLIHFCTDCDVFLCDGCLVEDHRQHVTISVKNRMKELRVKFLSYIKGSYTCTLDLQRKRDSLREMFDRKINEETILIHLITQTFEDIVRSVEIKRDELIHQAWAHFSRTKREINMRIQQIERELSQLLRCSTYLTSSAKLCSVRTLEENRSSLIQSCSLRPSQAISSGELPEYEQLKLKQSPHIEKAIRDSAALVKALNYSNIRPDLVLGEEGALIRPYGVVSDSKNRLFIADGPNKCVKVFREEKILYELKDENMNYPWALSIGGENLFVTDGLMHNLLKFSLEGTYIGKAGAEGDENEEMKNPMGVCCSPDVKLVYVCDGSNNRLQVWSSDLEWKSIIGHGKLSYPRDVSVTTEHMIIVLDEGNPCLHIYNKKGNLVGNYGNRGVNKTLVNPYFISMDQDGGIIVSDYGGNAVKVISLTNGQVMYRLCSGIVDGIEIKGPNGVFMDVKGRVLLACSESKKVIRFYFDK